MKYKIRDIRRSDETRIREISKDVWEGHDYVPDVFSEWAEDNAGVFIGIEVQDRLAGIARLSRFSDQVGWCEGLRVAEEFRGLKLAHILTEEIIKRARRKGLTLLNLSTHVKNEESIHIIEKYGFKLDGRFEILRFKFEEKDPSPPVPDIAPVTDKDRASSVILHPSGLARWNGYISYGWVFKSLDLEELSRHIEQRLVFIHGDKNGIILTEDSERRERLNLGYITGPAPRDLIDLALSLTPKLDRTVLNCMAPHNTAYPEMLQEEGFSRENAGEPDVLVYKRRL